MTPKGGSTSGTQTWAALGLLKQMEILHARSSEYSSGRPFTRLSVSRTTNHPGVLRDIVSRLGATRVSLLETGYAFLPLAMQDCGTTHQLTGLLCCADLWYKGFPWQHVIITTTHALFRSRFTQPSSLNREVVRALRLMSCPS